MTLYEALRHFADSYGLAVIFALYLALCLWHFLPGRKAHVKAAKTSIFREDDND